MQNENRKSKDAKVELVISLFIFKVEFVVFIIWQLIIRFNAIGTRIMIYHPQKQKKVYNKSMETKYPA